MEALLKLHSKAGRTASLRSSALVCLIWEHLTGVKFASKDIFFLFFNLNLFNWRIITLKYHVGFCHTSTWISHRYMHMFPPSWASLPLLPHPTPKMQSWSLFTQTLIALLTYIGYRTSSSVSDCSISWPTLDNPHFSKNQPIAFSCKLFSKEH